MSLAWIVSKFIADLYNSENFLAENISLPKKKIAQKVQFWWELLFVSNLFFYFLVQFPNKMLFFNIIWSPTSLTWFPGFWNNQIKCFIWFLKHVLCFVSNIKKKKKMPSLNEKYFTHQILRRLGENFLLVPVDWVKSESQNNVIIW